MQIMSISMDWPTSGVTKGVVGVVVEEREIVAKFNSSLILESGRGKGEKLVHRT